MNTDAAAGKRETVRPASAWSYPRTFWIANLAELFERAAYYGMFIALTLYLTQVIGFDDIWTGIIGAIFAAGLNLLPTFSGIMADRIGFRAALMLAFGLLAAGYSLLGLAGFPGGAPGGAGAMADAPAFGEPLRKSLAVLALGIAMLGGSIIKPVISGTVAKCSSDANRARAFSIFYAMVNIGAFSGKLIAKPLRTGFTIPGTDVHLELGLVYINFYAALMALLGLLLVAAAYRNVDQPAVGRKFADAVAGLLRVLSNVRFITLILIVAGFWAIQHQLYATMPKYIVRLIGPHAAPEWLANINPLVVVLCVVPITHLVRNWRAVNSIALALAMITLSAVTVSLSPLLARGGDGNVPILGVVLHPVTVVMIVGIAIQGLAECFLSPKFLEYASKQAPPGETGLYMGYSHLTSFFAYFFGFGISGWLLAGFCPDPEKLAPAAHEEWKLATTPGSGVPLPAEYEHAHYIWFVFAAIGLAAFVGMLIYRAVTTRLDRQRAATPPA